MHGDDCLTDYVVFYNYQLVYIMTFLMDMDMEELQEISTSGLGWTLNGRQVILPAAHKPSRKPNHSGDHCRRLSLQVRGH